MSTVQLYQNGFAFGDEESEDELVQVPEGEKTKGGRKRAASSTARVDGPSDQLDGAAYGDSITVSVKPLVKVSALPKGILKHAVSEIRSSESESGLRRPPVGETSLTCSEEAIAPEPQKDETELASNDKLIDFLDGQYFRHTRRKAPLTTSQHQCPPQKMAARFPRLFVPAHRLPIFASCPRDRKKSKPSQSRTAAAKSAARRPSYHTKMSLRSSEPWSRSSSSQSKLPRPTRYNNYKRCWLNRLMLPPRRRKLRRSDIKR